MTTPNKLCRCGHEYGMHNFTDDGLGKYRHAHCIVCACQKFKEVRQRKPAKAKHPVWTFGGKYQPSRKRKSAKAKPLSLKQTIAGLKYISSSDQPHPEYGGFHYQARLTARSALAHSQKPRRGVWLTVGQTRHVLVCLTYQEAPKPEVIGDIRRQLERISKLSTYDNTNKP